MTTPLLFGKKQAYYTEPPKSFKLTDAADLLRKMGADVTLKDHKNHQAHPHRVTYNGSTRGLTIGHGGKDTVVSLNQLANIITSLKIYKIKTSPQAKELILSALNGNLQEFLSKFRSGVK